MVAGKGDDWKNLKKIPGINELRVRDHMFGGGVIADGKEAMLFLGEDKPSLVIWSNHVGLVGFAREYFQFLWDSSETSIDFLFHIKDECKNLASSPDFFCI